MREAVNDESKADNRDQREQAAIRPFADLGDERGALVAPRDKHVRAEEDHKAEDFDGKSHHA